MQKEAKKAINALNGYTPPGHEQPLLVQLAHYKIPTVETHPLVSINSDEVVYNTVCGQQVQDFSKFFCHACCKKVLCIFFCREA